MDVPFLLGEVILTFKIRASELTFIKKSTKNFETNLEMDMFAQTWEESWEMDLIGLFNGTMQYNLTSHELIRSNNSGIVQGEGIDLEDDGKFTIMQNFSVDTRRKK